MLAATARAFSTAPKKMALSSKLSIDKVSGARPPLATNRPAATTAERPLHRVGRAGSMRRPAGAAPGCHDGLLLGAVVH